MLRPRQLFEDNIRPADLLLKVFRLLEHDAPNTEAELLRKLRELVKADKDEGLMVIVNDLFLGLIRERADVPPASIKRSALCNLLRQAVVSACTALETYLPTLLRSQLPEVIVHRADRSQDDPGGDAQDIGYPWTRQAVDTVRVVCLSLDELVLARLKELREQAAALQPQGAP